MNFDKLLKHAGSFEKVAQELMSENPKDNFYTLTTDFLNSEEVENRDDHSERVVQFEKDLPVLGNSSYYTHIGDPESEREYIEETISEGTSPFVVDLLAAGS